MPALAEKLVSRIRARGPLTFAEYMDAALYDPEHGYYTTHARIGFEGDYLTSPELGPMFGRSLARAAADLWSALGKPAQWDLVEAGAGRGTAMRDLLRSLAHDAPAASRSARPGIVEASPLLREEQARTLEGREMRWASSPAALAPISGVVYANEVLDAFPVHVLVRTDDGVKESFVDEKDGRLVEVLRAPSHSDLRWRVPQALPAGGRWEVSPAAEGWVASLASAVASGYVLFVDYGDDEAGLLARHGAGTVRGFARHRLLEDPFAAPGEHDLTATVNFTAIARAAEGAGLRLVGATTQRDALLALGARDATARSGDPREQLRSASRRAATDLLLDPNGLGGFRVVLYAKEVGAAAPAWITARP
ncbi:MAG TPA: SAM-dependent methyltransferase [Candidatus Limnocylindria bacterium]|nr:SAM-dependent methyltransferase [Candidatus Limnocylindria bacterium]